MKTKQAELVTAPTCLHTALDDCWRARTRLLRPAHTVEDVQEYMRAQTALSVLQDKEERLAFNRLRQLKQERELRR